MAELDDGYPDYYAERLWQLLPGIYRSADTDSFDTPGPLRELVNRIGGQIAVVRRSIDRLWEDQSIETCDDWAIPYIGDLLGTNLVNSLDARGQRLDVANTIHYRRRKGTVEVLEELARDVTGWDAHVVEGFRRLARTRHGLDPGLGPAAYPGTEAASVTGLLQAAGLLGPRSGTPAGGFLDLRDAHGAMLVDSPFDESFHYGDLRVGRGALGHFGIPKLLVHLWRLRSFNVSATPVEVPGCDGLAYAFDPTGREVPLFLAAPPDPDDFATSWTSALEWLVPGPLSSSLAKVMVAQGIAPAYTVELEGASVAAVHPELGRFETSAAPTGALTVDYNYGFSSTVGAGPYNRGLLGDPPAQVGTLQPGVKGGSGLDTALASAPAISTVVIEDSLTYRKLADVGTHSDPIVSLLCQAGPQQRPVIRVAPGTGPWVFTGGPKAELVLDGLLLCGCDLVLRGSFSSVRLTACTMDPGTAAAASAATPPGSAPLASAVDGTPLGPTRVFVEADPSDPAGSPGAIATLSVDHCVLGPIRTRNGGTIETLSISDSIVQALPTSSGSAYGTTDVYDPVLLAKGLLAADPLSKSLLGELPAGTAAALEGLLTGAPPAGGTAAVDPTILAGLNALVERSAPLYDPGSYPDVALSPAALALYAKAASLDAADRALLNRQLLDAAFPIALGLAALAVADATVELARVTVLGPVALHRLSASDSILTGFAAVDDVQSGCVRFSAIAAGSRVARQYLSVQVPAEAALFTSDAFGSPGYCQLLESADSAILAGGAGASITAGAEGGSQMGAFSSDLDPIKEQALLIKYAEYLPLGLTPVVVHVT